MNDELDRLDGLCPRKKCGEYNMLKCVRANGHDGECCFVVDFENDYEWNRARRVVARGERG